MYLLMVFKFFENFFDNIEFLNILSNNYVVIGYW